MIVKPKVFIDGEAGTTGLQIRERLAPRGDLELLAIDPAKRKDPTARAALMDAAAAVVLCLPDAEAREAVKLVTNPATKVIDASTAHRVADGWVFGFPEMGRGQRDLIRSAKRVANLGCWATGAIALLRPLVEAGALARDQVVSIHGVSGYSGGGKGMITEFENPADPTYTKEPYRIYGLELAHKHLPEIQKYAGLSTKPMFSPSVGRYAQGMLVEVPLFLAHLKSVSSPAAVHAILADAYPGERFVDVVPLETCRALKTLAPEDLNGTNRMKLFVFGSESQVRLVAQLDNLGKGASGAAVQNLNLMLGLDEAAGLS
ncbi:MAG: N-acetyl-gamma-glutamyl-phosphate reductase [Alphaproteobacteria bacterium]|nr:N-acetyl-gamma-glutamyl-phosphate reductase [Alphaproteobacteria bacterium]